MNADSIRIETDEDGFHLFVEDASARYSWRITDPEALYDHVKAAIGPWLREREEALREYDRAGVARRYFRADVPDSTGYSLTDPKHPDYHSIHADIHDMREGK